MKSAKNLEEIKAAYVRMRQLRNEASLLNDLVQVSAHNVELSKLAKEYSSAMLMSCQK